VLLAALTSQKPDRVFPFEALIEPPEGGLKFRSKVLLMQLRSVDKQPLVGRYGSISAETMLRVEEALKVAT
jgi:mRNA-degrading endonuclease toxin of MazEF toxin-antitoxin module